MKTLVANRGEIACRILRTCTKLGYPTVAIHAPDETDVLHVQMADEFFEVPSYLDQDTLLTKAMEYSVRAIHPGYGFLSENAIFAEKCEKNGIKFLGPRSEHIRMFALKHVARELAEKVGLNVLAGSQETCDIEYVAKFSKKIGFPIMVKPSAGGGGMDICLCNDETELKKNFAKVKTQAGTHYLNDAVYVEKFVECARHIEVQIFGDGQGKVVVMGVRECSIQRRFQKVIEESPPPGASEDFINAISEQAIRLCRSIKYLSVGTVEFLADQSMNTFYFLEVNPRLQVEHGITEMITGVDLVEWMLKEEIGNFEIGQGTAIEVRVCSEDPYNFTPSCGLIESISMPEMVGNIRCDTWIKDKTEIGLRYDSLIAKWMVYGETRQQAIEKLKVVLAEYKLHGEIQTNLPLLRKIINHSKFAEGNLNTNFICDITRKLKVLDGGFLTTVQDLGRFGYWWVGVPPSGPMDDRSFTAANELIQNDPNAACLEITISGPTLQFEFNGYGAIAGSDFSVDLTSDQQTRQIQMNSSFKINTGDIINIGHSSRMGCRCYLALDGGLDTPVFMGSRSTFVNAQIGVYFGRKIQSGDEIHVLDSHNKFPIPQLPMQPINNHWKIAVIPGPHGKEFFTEGFINEFYNYHWSVSFNSNRIGYRLNGPPAKFCRENGSEGGSHPSNVLDYTYSFGAINVTGEMPIILMKDGPSLGGFVCIATISEKDMWKVGQANGGDTIHFVKAHDKNPIIYRYSNDKWEVTYRRSGDNHILVCYGAEEFDLRLRCRIYLLSEQIKNISGILELSPGMQSVLVRYNQNMICEDLLVHKMNEIEITLDHSEINIPSRLIKMPISFNDSSIVAAIDRYIVGVRNDAPYLPSNLDFIKEANSLAEVEQVMDIITKAEYLVLGLGDVYLSAPCAIPVDPLHRLKVPKYNPARTYTPEGSVGIGGCTMCIYGMDSPGGYQLVGRTVPIWKNYRESPWFLKPFDRISFYPVSEEEMHQLRTKFRKNEFHLEIIEGEFSITKYTEDISKCYPEIKDFKQKQKDIDISWTSNPIQKDDITPKYQQFDVKNSLNSPYSGIVTKILVKAGDTINKGDTILQLEAMKLIIDIQAERGGVIEMILVSEGKPLLQGNAILALI